MSLGSLLDILFAHAQHGWHDTVIEQGQVLHHSHGPVLGGPLLEQTVRLVLAKQRHLAIALLELLAQGVRAGIATEIVSPIIEEHLVHDGAHDFERL